MCACNHHTQYMLSVSELPPYDLLVIQAVDWCDWFMFSLHARLAVRRRVWRPTMPSICRNVRFQFARWIQASNECSSQYELFVIQAFDSWYWFTLSFRARVAGRWRVWRRYVFHLSQCALSFSTLNSSFQCIPVSTYALLDPCSLLMLVVCVLVFCSFCYLISQIATGSFCAAS
jgi:hypothetical protein